MGGVRGPPSFNISPVRVSHRINDDDDDDDDWVDDDDNDNDDDWVVVFCDAWIPLVPLLLVPLLLLLLLLLPLLLVLLLTPVNASNNIATDSLNHTNTTIGSPQSRNSPRIISAGPSTFALEHRIRNCDIFSNALELWGFPDLEEGLFVYDDLISFFIDSVER